MNTQATLRKASFAGALVALAVVSACSSAPRSQPYRADPYSSAPVAAPGYNSAYAQYGVVRDIERMPMATRSPGGGALLGGVIGAVVGNQVGSGNGRAAATVVGAVGGAMVGNNIENRNARADDIYRVTVSLQNGDRASFDFRQVDDLRVGDRVRVEGGQVYRL
ncbi:MAG: glycine zipper 2TM domain-containing protein [Burkholderiaceae bacterium]